MTENPGATGGARQRGGLGRGLGALIPRSGSGSLEVDVEEATGRALGDQRTEPPPEPAAARGPTGPAPLGRRHGAPARVPTSPPRPSRAASSSARAAYARPPRDDGS